MKISGNAFKINAIIFFILLLLVGFGGQLLGNSYWIVVGLLLISICALDFTRRTDIKHKDV